MPGCALCGKQFANWNAVTIHQSRNCARTAKALGKAAENQKKRRREVAAINMEGDFDVVVPFTARHEKCIFKIMDIVTLLCDELRKRPLH